MASPFKCKRGDAEPSGSQRSRAGGRSRFDMTLPGRGLDHVERREAWRLRSLGDDVLKSVRVDGFGCDNDIDGFTQPLYLAVFSLQVAKELLPHVLARNARTMVDLVFGEHLSMAYRC